MALQLWALALLGLAGTSASLRPRKLDSFRSETELNHLVVDEASGMVYVGAVNMLYQLSADLQLEQRVATGPALDNKKCTPPIEVSQCHEAVQTDNVNQLLLLDPPGAAWWSAAASSRASAPCAPWATSPRASSTKTAAARSPLWPATTRAWPPWAW